MATKNNILRLYVNNEYKEGLLEPAPFIGISSTSQRNEAAYLHTEYTINLEGYALPSGACAIEEKTDGCGNHVTLSRADQTFDRVAELQAVFYNHVNGALRLDICDPGGRIKSSFSNLIVESTDFEPGTWHNYAKYKIVMKSYSGYKCDDADNPHLSSYLKRVSGKKNLETASPGDSGVLTDYQESFSIEPVFGEFGYGTNNQENAEASGPQIGSVYYKGSYSTTISAKSISKANYKKLPPTDTDKLGWQIARGLFEMYRGDVNHPPAAMEYYLNDGIFEYGLSTKERSSEKLKTYNIVRSQSMDAHTGSYTVTDNFIIAPHDAQTVETFSCSYESDGESPNISVTVQGNIKGLSLLDVTNQVRLYTDFLDGTPIEEDSAKPSGMIDRAMGAFHALSNNKTYGQNCVFFQRAQANSGYFLNSAPRSISYTTNDVAGEVNYSLVFDNKPDKFFTGVIVENINVEDTLPGDSYTTIPILGRPTGPILQYLYGRTEYKRTLSIELVFDNSVVSTALTFPNSNRTNMLASKPSIRKGFKEQLASCISSYSPANEDGIQNWFQDPAVETWNQSDCRYTCTITWIYELDK